MQRTLTTVRLVVATSVAAAVGILVPGPATADFNPNPFDSSTAGTSAIFTADFSSSTVGAVPAGWTGSGWQVRDTALNSVMPDPDGGGGLGPAPTGVIPVLTGNFVALDNSVQTSGTITSPVIDLTTATTPFLTFDVHSFFLAGSEGNQGYDTDKSYVQINVLDAAGTLIDQVFELGDTDLNGAAGWLPQRVRLADFAGQQIRLQVVYVDEGASSTNDQHDIALDNIEVVDAPTPSGDERIPQLAAATYFLPISAADVGISQSNIYSNVECAREVGPQDTATMLTSITIGDTEVVNGTETSALVLYDHVEDGFGPTGRRTQASTELWGDGDPSNGFPPGHPEDLLFPGEVVILRNISDPGVATPLAPGSEVDSYDSTEGYTMGYDAGDRLTSPVGLIITRVGWSDGSSTLLAGAVEVTDVSGWGTAYEMPIGQDLSTSGVVANSFEYVGASVMARNNGTVVTVPGGTVSLDAGETYFINGGLLVGDEITSTGGPISVNVMAGNVCSTFEGRWFRIDPVRLFDTEYYTPVGPTSVGNNSAPNGGTSVLLYNPGATSITIDVYDDDSATVAQATLTVAAGTTARYDIVDTATGSSFMSRDEASFYALQSYDTGSTQRDWGFALLGLDQLSPVLQAGLAIGVDPTSGNTTDINSPLWIAGIWTGPGTPSGGTTICIDWNGDGGPNTTNEVEYDITRVIDAHLDNEILDEGDGPPSNDLTGTKAFVCNPSNPDDPNLTNWVLAGAWGQDTSGPGGSPSIDVGTGVFNLPSFSIEKQLASIEDDNNNGIVDVGDTIRYTITARSTSGVAVLANRIKIWDNLPPQLDYVEGSTTISPELAPLGGGDPEAVPDDSTLPTLSPTPFPLDDGDPSNDTLDDPNNEFTDTVDDGLWWNRPLLGGGSFTVTFDAEILEAPANNLVVNTAFVTDGRVVRSDAVAFELPEYITVGDRVWLDEDGDGVQDAGEDGIAGVPVTLTYTPSDGVPVVLTTITDADGGYVFIDLPVLPVGEAYTISIVAPAGMDQTSDEQGPLDLTIELVSDPLSLDASNPLALQPGDEHMTADFGLNWVPPVNTDNGTGVGAIGDRIWSDADGDGVQDPGEAGLAGVTVNLFTDPDGDGVYDTPAGTTTTDANGNYIFDDLAPDVYVVVVDEASLPADMAQTGDPDAALDHASIPIPFPPGDVYVNADFGYQPVPGSTSDNTIGDTVWFDGNGDGVVDADEFGIGGVSVVLLDEAGNVVATTRTDSDGAYLFAGVPAGTYQVWVNDADNVLGEFAPISDADGVLDARHDVTVTGGDAIDTADFGYAPPSSDSGEGIIGDTIFIDANGNGIPDPGEGIEGVRVELRDEFERLVGVTYTNENGQYAFGDLPATVDGPYLVVVDTDSLPQGLTASVDPDGGADSAATTLLGEGEQIYTMDFGYVAAEPATLSGTIWEDADADGVLGSAEAGRFEGVTVELIQLVEQTVTVTDPDTQEQIELTVTTERVIGTTITDTAGNYSFAGLAGGDYIVRVADDDNLLGGYWHSDAPAPGTDGQSQHDEGYAVTVAPGSTDTTADFGYYLEPGAVGDTVFDDANGNGVFDSGEVGIPGATLQLVISYPDGTQTTMVATTDASGNYEFDNLLLDEDHNGDTATAGVPEPTFVVSVADLPAAYADAVSTHPQSPTAVDSTTVGGTPADDLDADDPAGEPAFPGQGTTDATNDFGYVNEAVVGDLVWDDLDGDGILDAGEPGIGGVVVNLYRDGVLADTVTTSDGTIDIDGDGTPEPLGTYFFTDLLPGDYVVEFIAPADYVFSPADQGGDDAADSDADAAGRTAAITIAAEQTDLTIDAGLYVPVAIGDLVFDDANGSGTYDGAATDPGIGGVTVSLFEDTTGDGVPDTLVSDTTTISTPTDIDGDGIVDPIGSYWFGDLPPGSYGVVVETTTGPVASTDDWSNTADPDGTLDAQTTTAIVLASGQTDTDQDFGFFRPAVIGDTIFYDADNDGVQDPGETGLNGVTVQLVDADGTVVDEQVTADGGTYLFENVTAGTYTVRVDTSTLPAGFDDATNTADPDAGGDSTAIVTVESGESNLDQDFGYFDPGTIGDAVFHDVNGDGVQGDPADEPGIGGVTVELRDSTGTVIDTQVTSATGQYLFTGLADGSYTVTVVTATLPAAFAPAINSGDPDVATSDKDAPGDSTSIVDLDSAGATLAGVSDLTQDFGYFVPASIGDRVFEDVDNDGVQDAGEPGFPGVTVQLLDTAANVIATTSTSADGSYSFDNLAPGDYTVRIDETTLPIGAVQTFEKATAGNTLDGSTDQSVVAGDEITDVDFGYFRPATIGDFVWDDLDGDGVQDDGEPGVLGVTVELLDSLGNVVESTTTDGDGLYTFTDVIPGEYTVRFTIPNGDHIFSPADQGGDALDSDALDDADNNVLTAETAPFAVGSGDLIDTIDAGLVQTGSLGDRVWDDLDGDGVQDDGEPGLEGATVTLYTVGDPTPIDSFTTLADGLYTFDDLAPGDYYVVVTPPATDDWLISPQSATGATDTTAADDSDIDATGTSDEATVAIGEDVTTLDAGFVRAGSIGDRVWQDLDGNGRQDAGEPGVPAVTVELLDAAGDVIATTATGPTGLYAFTGLYPGEYSVQFTAPDGNVFSPQDAPIATDTTDSDANPSGLTSPVSLVAGDDLTNVDAGVIETGSIGDRVWNDIDGDGIQDDGELGLPGVIVRLLDAAGNVVDTTATNGDGIYLFSGLVPGDYSVRFESSTATDSYIFSPQATGTNGSVDSDADPSTGETSTIALAHGQDIDTVDAGLGLPATISGVVTEDITDDTTGDLPLEGITVELYLDTDGDGAPDGDPIDTTTTGPTGEYTFAGLLPGDYVVVEVNPAGYIDIADADTTDDGDAFDADGTVDSTIPVTLTQGETDNGNDFVDRLPASIEIIKTAGTAADGDDFVAAGVVGTTVDFTFVVTNTGTAPLTDVTVTDPFTGLSAIDCAPLTNGSFELASGDSATCRATHQLTQDDIDDGSLLNAATVTAERPGGTAEDTDDDVSDTDTATVSIPREPELSIVKVTNGVDHTSAPGLITATDAPITWTYTVANTGNVALADVTVTDDAGTSLVTDDDFDGAYVSGDADLDGLLDVGELWVFEATGVATEGQYTNVAVATGNPVDDGGTDIPGLDAPTADDDDFYFAATAAIDIQKTVALGADADCATGVESVDGANGTAVTYCFTVTNTGNVPLDSVVVDDPDLGITNLAVAATLLPAASVTVSVTSAIDGDLTNTATATGTPIDTVSDPANPTPFDPTVVPAPADDDTAAVDETPTFTVTKTNDADGDGTYRDTESAQASVSAVPFRVVITNTGADPLTFTSITDAVASVDRPFTDLACVLGSTEAAVAAGDIIPAGDIVTCTFSSVVDLTALAAETDVITVGLSDDDGNTVPNSDDSTVGGAAIITHDKTFVSATDPETDGLYTVVYTVRVANSGTTTGSYSVSDAPGFDTDLTIDGATAAVAATGTNTPATPADFTTAPWSLAVDQALAPGEAHTFTLTFTVDGSALLADPALYDACDGLEPASGEGLFNEATLVTEAGAIGAVDCGDLGIPDIELTKTFVSALDADDDGVYDVTYTITAENTGTGDGIYAAADTPAFDSDLDILGGTATAVSTTDENVPSAPGAYGDGTWTLARAQPLATGETHTYTLTFEVDATAVVADPNLLAPCGSTPVAGEGLFNEATLRYAEVVRNDDACGDLPLLTIAKQGPTILTDLDGDGEIDLDDTLGYTIVVANAGGVALTGVTVDDTIIAPGDLTCVRGDDSAFDHVDGGSLAVGESVTCTGTYVVVANDVIAARVVNVATADSNETPPVDDTVTGLIPPAITIDKTAAAPVSLGDGQYRITYTVEVGNTGSAGTYSLDDELQFGGGISIDAADIANTVPGTIDTDPGWNGTISTVVVPDTAAVSLGYNETHVYVVTVDATVDPAVATLDDVACPAPGSGDTGGFANTATVSMDDDVVSDDACQQPPAPEVTITKQVTSGPTLNDDGTYDVQYLVTVRNQTNGVGLYDLVDELQFGGGIVVLDAEIVNVAPGSIPVEAGWNGVDATLAVDDSPITALDVHTYRVTVNADALGLVTPAAGDCSTDTPPTAGGFLNVATVTSGGDTDTADDCAPVPPPGLSITKLVDPDSPVSNGDGSYTVSYTVSVVNSEAGPGLYSLSDDLRFGEGVDVVSAAVTSTDVADDLSTWAGSGSIVTGVRITGLTTHEYTVTAVVRLLPTMTTTARDCTLDEGETGTGFLNGADLIVAGEIIDEDEACVQTPAPAIVVTKNIVDDGVVQNPDGTYSVTYEVLVTNNGGAAGQYELDDELTFGEGITISAAVIESTVPDTLVTDPNWDGQTARDITVTPVTIDGTDDDAGTSRHVYRIVVSGDASNVAGAAAGDCTLDLGETGTGYLNTARLTVEGVTTEDNACDPNPAPEVGIVKTLTAGPTLAADGTFTLEYQLIVTNTGGFGTYDLEDAGNFGAGVTVVPGTAIVEVTDPADGSIEAGAGWVGDNWDAVANTGITTGQSIAPGGSHVYVVRMSATVDPVVIDYDVDAACPAPGSGDQGGFLNTATVTTDGVEQSDEACSPVPAPAVALSKTITSGPTDLGDGTYEITYDIVVTNNGEGPDAYVLDDELRFGDGITVLGSSVTNVAPGSITVSPAWTGTDETRVVTDEPIAGLTSHTYRVVTTVDALTVLTTDDGACSTGDAVEAGGFLNVALISSYSTTTTADDCDEVPLPDISIAKAIATGPTERVAEPGVYDITYDVVVSNAGPGSGRYDLADDLAFGVGVSVLSASVASSDVATDISGWSGSGVIVTDEPIANGGSHTFTVTVAASVAPSTLADARDCLLGDGENGTGLRNVAGVSGPLVTSQQATACAPIPTPTISVDKSVVSPATLVTGQTYDITYEIVATNAGLGIGEYDIDDTLAFGAGVTVVSAVVTSDDVDLTSTAWNGTTVTDVLDDVALPGASSHTYTVQVRFDVAAGTAPTDRDCVLDPGEAGTGLLNTVSIMIPGSDTPIDDEACDEIPDPEMTVTKTVVSGPTLGDDGTYTISYRVVVDNIGDGPGAYDLVDEPTFGPAITITSATVASSDVTLPTPLTWNPNAGEYTVATGVALPAGASDTYTMTFVTSIDPVELDGTIATCDGAHGSDETEYFNRVDVLVDGAVEDTDTACEPPPAPKLEIDKSVSPTPLVVTSNGIYEVVYTIEVSNTGNGPTAYTLTDSFAFGEGVEVVSVAVIEQPATATLIAGFDGDTRIEVATATLPAKTTHTYQIEVRVDANGITSEEAFDCELEPGETGTGLLNRATVNPTDEACVEIPKITDLELTKDVAPDSVDVGQNATFTISVTNAGPADTTGVTVTEELPDGLTYVSHSADGSYDQATGIWNIGDLAVGASATLEVTVRVDTDGPITNTAQIRTSDLPDPDSTPGNDVPAEDDQDSATVTGVPVVVVLPPTLPTVTTPSSAPPVTLTPTGSETGTPIRTAIWLLLAGAAMLAVASRRRREI